MNSFLGSATHQPTYRLYEDQSDIFESLPERHIPIPRSRRNSGTSIADLNLIGDEKSSRSQPRVNTPSTDAPFEPVFKLTPSASSSYVSRCLSDFEFIERIGKGGYGEVFKVKNHLDGCMYALKRIKLGNDDAKNSRILREVSALSRLSHPHIIRYYQAWIEAGAPSFGQTTDDTQNEMEDEDISETDASFFFDDQDMDACHSSHVMDTLRSSGSYSSNLLTCNVCNHLYNDWEVSFFDWRIISAGLQNLCLCQECYKDQLKKCGIELSQIKITTKPPLPLYLYIQMEFCEKTLRAAMDDKSLWRTQNENQIWSIFRQIVEATAYIHSNSCMHRDLKPGNIFLSSDGTVKLGDFGLITGEIVLQEASNSLRRRTSQTEEQIGGLRPGWPSLSLSTSPRSISSSPSVSAVTSPLPMNLNGSSSSFSDEEKTSAIGTAMYRAPELERGRKYDEKIDLYSLGIILFELWSPFDTGMERFVVINQLRNNRKIPASFSQKYPIQSDVILRLTSDDSSSRPTALSLLSGLPVPMDPQMLQHQVLNVVSENITLKSELQDLRRIVSELKGLVEEMSIEKNRQHIEILRLNGLLQTTNAPDQARP